MKQYYFIIHKTRPVPTRPRMPRQNRAKIFAPYQALKGLNETLHSKDTVYVRRRELTEYAQECIDKRLRQLRRSDVATVTWFCPKPGEVDLGQYITVTGIVERVDPVFRVLLLSSKSISIENILDLRGDWFD